MKRKKFTTKQISKISIADLKNCALLLYMY